jgi:spore maturation protein CgeB
MRILLTGDFFHDYENDLKEGLEQNGHEVDMRFNNIHGPFHFVNPKTSLKWIKYGLLPYKLNIKHFTWRATDRYNRDLEKMIQKKTYDALLVIGAKTIFHETVNAFKGRKIFYFMDALPQYESVFSIIPLFDDHFVFEPTDVAVMKERLGLHAHFLSLAFSPSRYFRKKRGRHVYDFSFVGSNYPKREEYLDALLAVSENMCIYGDFYKSKYPKVREKTKKINVPFSIANDLYNSSNINVNIHHPQSKEGLSIRTFEIIGAGGFQLVERQKAAIQFFEENKHMAFYDGKQDFLDKARYFLAHEKIRQQIADNCYRLAMEKHTWRHRMREMFEVLYS